MISLNPAYSLYTSTNLKGASWITCFGRTNSESNKIVRIEIKKFCYLRRGLSKKEEHLLIISNHHNKIYETSDIRDSRITKRDKLGSE